MDMMTGKGADGPIFIYPKGKLFEMSIDRDEEANHRIMALVRTRGWNGLKMYLWAQRMDDHWLAIHLRDYPDQNQNW